VGIKRRRTKQVIMLFADLLYIPIAIYLALYIRLGDFDLILKYSNIFSSLLTILFSVGFFLSTALYRSVIRYMGHDALLCILKSVAISTLIFVASYLLTQTAIPRTVPFLYFGILITLMGGSRYLIRYYYADKLQQNNENIAIYGAGSAGHQLLKALHHHHEYSVKGFVDDNKAIIGTIINGVRVYPPKQLEKLIKEKNISQILLAMPSVSGSKKKQVINFLENLPVQIKTIPTLDDIVSGKAKIEEIKELDIEDLLGRASVSPDNELFEHCIKDKVVLVTGGGGSIGSELCRQIIKHSPNKLIIYELSEYALYEIEKELKKNLTFELPIIALLGSVQDKTRLKQIMSAYGVQTVYHAAAYKHVPLVEENVVEGVKNNIFGTYMAALAALEQSVETFVLISTDKAVRPTNIMGASKRFAELILQALAEEYKNNSHKTRYCMVRFGNVLGSSGSVVPLFKQQIKHGGPVTVTDPEIVRYFMTIPEAAQLVLQASSMGQGGDVYVLDMGEPVKIAELAQKMIHLSGLEIKDSENPDGEIEIIYTGLRPGEKLYEELLIGDNVSQTQHPAIMRAEEKMLSLPLIEEQLTLLQKACDNYDINQIVELLINSETAYTPQVKKSADLLWWELKNKVG